MSALPHHYDRRSQVLREAWLGDAVLALYARERILREDQVLDGPKAERMSSNRFLSAFGEPSEVEAAIGRVYQKDGLAEAFAFIEARYMPLFLKHEERRQTVPRKRRAPPLSPSF